MFFSGLFLTSPKCLSILNFFLLGQVDETCVEENQAGNDEDPKTFFNIVIRDPSDFLMYRKNVDLIIKTGQTGLVVISVGAISVIRSHL